MSLENFQIIESTLREGEQFANAFFNPEQKIEIARMLDAFGVEYLELTSPAASPRSAADCAAIAGLGLKAKILTHVRCHMDDARIAIDTGVDGIDVVFGTSSLPARVLPRQGHPLHHRIRASRSSSLSRARALRCASAARTASAAIWSIC